MAFMIPFRLRKPSVHMLLAFSMLVGCSALIALDGWSMWHARSVALEDDKTETSNLARSLAQHMHDTVLTADTVLTGMQERTAAEPWTPAMAARLDAIMTRRIADLPLVQGFFIFDGTGTQIGGSTRAAGQGIADRPFFQAHRDQPDLGLLVMGPFQSRRDGTWIISLSRRRDGADGRFAGLLTATLSIDQLVRFYDSFDTGDHGILSLVHTDRTMLARSPARPGMVGAKVSTNGITQDNMPYSPVGSFRYTSSLDGVDRLGSFRLVDGYPLVVVVAHGIGDVLAEWWRYSVVHMSISLGVAAAMGWLGLRMSRQIKQREQAERRYRLLADNSSDAIVCMGLDGKRLYVSPSFRSLTGWTVKQSLASEWGQLVHPADRPQLRAASESLRNGMGTVTLVYRYMRPDGSFVWVEARCHRVDRTDEEAQFICNIRDVSERKAAEEKMAALNAELLALANIDGLTGLANRRCFDEALARESRRMGREHAPLSLVLLDLDRFKRFNDVYGHPAGDACLRAVSETMASFARRPGDTAARYGGEELVLLLPSTDAAGAFAVAERVRAAIERMGIVHDDNQPSNVVTVSVGVATILLDHEQARAGSDLIAMADAALYKAKHTGRNRVVDHEAVLETKLLPTDETSRLAAVARFDRELPEALCEALDRLAYLAATLFEAPIALISIVGQESQRFVGRYGLALEGTPRQISICAHALGSGRVFIVPDASTDPRFSDNPLVTQEPRMRFYAGAPLRDADGTALGALCIIDSVPRPVLSGAQQALLIDMAALAASRLMEVGSQAPT